MLARTEFDGEIAVRPATTDDQGYITTSWARSLIEEQREGAKDDWATINTQIDRLLDDPGTKLLVAAEPRSSRRILGWVAFAKAPGTTTLLYVHVRPKYRHVGICRALLEVAGVPPPTGRLAYLYPAALCRAFPGAIRVTPEAYLQP